MSKSHRFLVSLCFTALMAALSILLCRVLGYSPGNSMFRVEIGFLPIAVVAILAGPWYAATGYAVADLVGAAIFTPPINPLITLCKILFGILLGIFLYKKKCGIVRISVTMLIIGVAVDVGLMSGVFVLMGYSPTYLAAFTTRAANMGINLPIRILVLFLVCHFCGSVFRKYERQFHD